jgi:hypothetical protein
LTITEFLLARITEDEAVARTATDDRFSWASVDYNSSECETHGTRHNPARTLAECAAKRALVERYWQEDIHSVSEAEEQCGDCLVMYILAAVHADHPDYHPEWAL